MSFLESFATETQDYLVEGVLISFNANRDLMIDGELCKKTSRAIIAPDVLRTLNDFAARTYAPVTEESRIKGAGGAD